jgi:cell division protein FtsB
MVTDFEKKRNREDYVNRMLFQIAGIFVLIILIILVVADFKMYQKKQELSAQLNSYQKKIDDIKKSNQALKDEIANSDNLEYLEKVAYEQGMTKPGEREVIFVSPKNQTLQSSPIASKNVWANFTGWLSGSWQWIKSKF